MAEELQRAGRYEILGKIGAGGMGSVYRAKDPVIGRTVAVKAISFNTVANEEERRDLQIRTAREARSAGILSHPNIVTIHDVGQQSGVAYIVMELVDGPTLWKKFVDEKKLKKSAFLNVIKQSASALDYAHENRIIHRDVKPSNILIRPDGMVKLTDFGVAKILEADQLTRTGLMVGTPNYMAPEQVKEQFVSNASDQFALGVIAYELLTGVKPFEASKFTALLYKIVTEEPDPCSSLNDKLPKEVDDVVARVLEKEPGKRFESCMAFAEALEKACEGIGEDDLGERRVPVETKVDEPDEVRHASALRKVGGEGEPFVGLPETGISDFGFPGTGPTTDDEPTTKKPLRVEQPTPNRTLLWAGGGALLVLLAVGLYALIGGGMQPAPEPEATVETPAENGAGVATPVEGGTETQTEAAAGQTGGQATPDPEPPPVRPTPAPTPQKKAAPPPDPAPAPTGGGASGGSVVAGLPTTTTIIWRGELEADAELTITGDQASSGSLSRGLPGQPVSVELSPSTLEILEAPSAANGWNRLRIRNGDRKRTLIFIRYRGQ